MFLRRQDSGATGSFEVYKISSNNIVSAALLGQLGGEVQGFGNFGSRGENDVLLRNGAAFSVADIANDQITGTVPLGTVGLNWQLGGFGNFSGNPGAYDMLLRDMNSGGLQVLAECTKTACHAIGRSAGHGYAPQQPSGCAGGKCIGETVLGAAYFARFQTASTTTPCPTVETELAYVGSSAVSAVMVSRRYPRGREILRRWQRVWRY
jgi:hypothetical protein